MDRLRSPGAGEVETAPQHVECEICHEEIPSGVSLEEHFRTHGGPPEARAKYGCNHGTLYVELWFGLAHICAAGPYAQEFGEIVVDWGHDKTPDVLRRIVEDENAGRLALSGRYWPRTWRSAMELEAIYHEPAAGPSQPVRSSAGGSRLRRSAGAPRARPQYDSAIADGPRSRRPRGCGRGCLSRLLETEEEPDTAALLRSPERACLLEQMRLTEPSASAPRPTERAAWPAEHREAG